MTLPLPLLYPYQFPYPLPYPFVFVCVFVFGGILLVLARSSVARLEPFRRCLCKPPTYTSCECEPSCASFGLGETKSSIFVKELRLKGS